MHNKTTCYDDYNPNLEENNVTVLDSYQYKNNEHNPINCSSENNEHNSINWDSENNEHNSINWDSENTEHNLINCYSSKKEKYNENKIYISTISIASNTDNNLEGSFQSIKTPASYTAQYTHYIKTKSSTNHNSNKSYSTALYTPQSPYTNKTPINSFKTSSPQEHSLLSNQSQTTNFTSYITRLVDSNGHTTLEYTSNEKDYNTKIYNNQRYKFDKTITLIKLDKTRYQVAVYQISS
ncbi:MAG: hypothetical protein AAFO15_00610 [Pseudomonadota bacterium]